VKTLIAMTAATLLTTLAAPALAQSTTDAAKAVVSYADLNLSSASGQAVLHTRIARAVDSVCPSQPRPNELSLQQEYTACHQQAWDSVRQQLAAMQGDQKLAKVALPYGHGN
jgi:UrcA family protein